MRTILTVDGGGMRGTIPAVMLAQLEAEFGAPLSSGFDLMAGVSTGGILVTGLSSPPFDSGARIAAEDMVRFYTEDGPVIFKKRWGYLLRPKYDADVLFERLRTRLPAALLSDTECEVLTTAYSMNYGTAVKFCTELARREQTYNFRLADIAAGGSLAPTYFGSRSISPVDGSRLIECIDGGVARNNVGTLAVVHARKLWPGEPIAVLSLGTGVQTRPPSGSGSGRNWGALKWAPRVISTFMDASADFVGEEVANLVDRYVRVNPQIENGAAQMDNASEHNLSTLYEVGLRAWRESDLRIKGQILPAMKSTWERKREQKV